MTLECSHYLRDPTALCLDRFDFTTRLAPLFELRSPSWMFFNALADRVLYVDWFEVTVFNLGFFSSTFF